MGSKSEKLDERGENMDVGVLGVSTQVMKQFPKLCFSKQKRLLLMLMRGLSSSKEDWCATIVEFQTQWLEIEGVLRIFRENHEGSATSGDDKKGRILGKWVLNVDGMPKLKNGFPVEDLNQLFDLGMLVKFTRESYKVTGQSSILTMEGARSFDHSYSLVEPLTCYVMNNLATHYPYPC